MRIISGRSNSKLTQKICDFLKIQALDVSIETLNDSEIIVEISEPLHDETVVVVQSTSRPVNDHLMELLLLVDAAKRAGARRIIAVIPYFGYSRQDRRLYQKYSAISMSVISSMLENCGVDHVVTIDLHSTQTEGFFKIPVENINVIDLFSPIIQEMSSTILVAPDFGAMARNYEIQKYLNMDMCVVSKRRGSAISSSLSGFVGDVDKRKCIIIDDILDSASTVCNTASLLIEKGASAVSAFVTHPVLSSDAKEKIENSPIDVIYVSDTIEHLDLIGKFRVISVASVIARKLLAIVSRHENKF